MIQNISGKAQANVTLSNLRPTSINADLLPGTSNHLWLGSGARNWQRLYLSDALYLGNVRFVSFGNTGALSTSGVTSIGIQALSLNTTGTNNSASGYQALFKNTTGSSNTAMGSLTLSSNNTGSNNSAYGSNALGHNSTGSSNTAVGFESMVQCKSGYNSTAVGSRSLYWNYYGGENTAIGMESLFENDNGNQNTAAGARALWSNSSGNGNTAVGYNALSNNATTSGHTAIGAGALGSMGVGSGNVAIGYQAVGATVTSSYTTAVGYQALYTSNSANGNTAIGYQTLYSSSSGVANTGLGMHVLRNNTTGIGNVGTGISALYNVTIGSYNTAIGSYADVGNGALYNATAVGYLALATGSNQIMLGNSSVTSVRSTGSYVLVSDGRFKKDVKADVPGLDFIKELRPVTYHYNVRGMNEFIGAGELQRDNSSSSPDQLNESAISAKEQKLYTGFVAQEVEAAAKKHNYDFSGVYSPTNSKDLYGISYSDFVMPLVKAVQELSLENDSLKANNDSLNLRLQRLESAVYGSTPSGATISDAWLGANQPNPFRNSTTINYFLPATYGRAKLQVSDMSGRIIKTIGIAGSGRGSMKLDASGLSGGVYSYTFYIDDKIIGTEKMVVTK